MKRGIVRPLHILLPLAIFVVCGVPNLHAQNVEDALEFFIDQGGSDDDIEEAIETWSDLKDTKPSINDPDSYIPEWVISPFLRGFINAYIEQNGYILSWEELSLVNGIDSTTTERLRQTCSLEKPDIKAPRLKEILKHGRHNLVTGSNITLEQSRGYKEHLYEGKPYRLYTRYKFAYKDYFTFQLSAEKDPGESLFYGCHRQGFDLYSGHLMVSRIGHLKSAVVGRYRLQFGQGLTLWSGSKAFLGWNTLGIRYGRGICVSSPFAESDYLQGTAVTVSLVKGLDLTAFYSYSRRDASSDSTSSIQSILTTGYHRTAAELQKKGTLGEHLYGGNLQWNFKALHIGATFYRTVFDKPLQPKSYVYNADAFRGRFNSNAGIDASYRWRRVLLFGELAVSQGGGMAGIAGADFMLNPDNKLSVIYRNYSGTYHNLHASTWGRLSLPQNEEGLRLALQSLLPLRISLLFQGDLYRHRGLRYSCYSPSYGTDLRTDLLRKIPLSHADQRSLTLRLSHRYSNFMRNDSQSTTHEYLVERLQRHLLYADVDYLVGNLEFRSHVGYSHFASESGDAAHGVVLLEDVSATFANLTIGGRVALFDTENYDSRLYVAEKGLEYDNGGSALYGKGLRFYLIARYSLADKLSVGLKYSVTAYVDRSEIGSGYDLIDSPHKQQIRVQLRFKW